MKTKHLSIKELAAFLGVSTDTIRRAFRKGEIPATRVRTALRFDLHNVLTCMRRNAEVRFGARSARAPGGESRPRAARNAPGVVKHGGLADNMSESSPESNTHVFTLNMDWLAFTLPDVSAQEVMRQIGGEWTKGKAGFRGYPLSWILTDTSRGVGVLGTGAPRQPREVHADLSAGIVSPWDLSRMRNILQWIKLHEGHVTRIDCALDDRQAVVPLQLVTQAAEIGQCISRADRIQMIRSFSLHKGTASGETIYFGSPQSQTLLRVYDKRLELLAKKCPGAEEYGIRWELEFKQDRAQLCSQSLIGLEEQDWKGFLIGLLRSYVDFRDTTRDAEDEERARAPRLPWYESLTRGFMTARLTIPQEEPEEERVKVWIIRSVAPMLAALCALPHGQAWVECAILEGADRFKDRHRQLIKKGTRKGKIPSS